MIKNLRDALVAKRYSAGETAVQAAKKLKITSTTLSHWENGRNTPKVTQWKKIAKYLEIDIQEVCKLIEHDKV